jgi:hypothetical protein
MKNTRAYQQRWLLHGFAALLLLTIGLRHERPSSANTQTNAAENRPNIVFIMLQPPKGMKP